MSDMPIRRGVHAALEAEANRLIKESLAGVTKHSEKADILTPWKEQERYRREVYTREGSPDRATRSGIFGRTINRARPALNSRGGVARPQSRTSSLTEHVDYTPSTWGRSSAEFGKS